MPIIANCQLCEQLGKTTKAVFDQATVWGPWAYLCFSHSMSHGAGTPTHLDRVK